MQHVGCHYQILGGVDAETNKHCVSGNRYGGAEKERTERYHDNGNQPGQGTSYDLKLNGFYKLINKNRTNSSRFRITVKTQLLNIKDYFLLCTYLKYLIENCKSVYVVEGVRDGIESAVAEQEKSHHGHTDGYTV